MQYPHICLFVGHRDSTEHLYPAIVEAVGQVIAQGVTEFWSGGYGHFDFMGEQAVLHWKRQGANVRLVLVLAYLPSGKEDAFMQDRYARFDEIIRPELAQGHTPPRYAISRRNATIARQAGHVISGVKYTWGGAAKTLEIARKSGAAIHQLALKT